MIRVENISKTFDDYKVLKDISVTFDPGKINLIIGQSGSGKTVLLKAIVGLHEVDQGSIFYDDRDFVNMSFLERKAIRKEIGMVFQGGALFDSINVEENVRYPLDMFTRMSQAEKIDRVNFCLEKVNIKDANKKYPAELSGGMRKRVAIARAIALHPRYLMFDEPNSGLDPKTSVLIDELIVGITREFNTTTIINTHDMNSVIEIGEKVVFIYEGSKWLEGSRNGILDTENPELRDFIAASGFLQKR
jgi:phospholipid/cholesterol/gamma-HCH transport system ATP-binding protein